MRSELNFEMLSKILLEINKESSISFSLESKLIGPEKIIDSLGLVQLCVSLEDLGEEFGFNFDWTSEVAMSRSQSMFRNLQSLIDEFNFQAKE
jgi:hypothetical protein